MKELDLDVQLRIAAATWWKSKPMRHALLFAFLALAGCHN